MLVNVDYTELHVRYVIFFRSILLPNFSSPTPSIIHSCAYNLVEELLKYGPFLFLYVSKLLTMKNNNAVSEIIWMECKFLADENLFFASRFCVKSRWVIFISSCFNCSFDFCMFMHIHPSQLETNQRTQWTCSMNFGSFFAGIFLEKMFTEIRKLQHERMWSHNL